MFLNDVNQDFVTRGSFLPFPFGRSKAISSNFVCHYKTSTSVEVRANIETSFCIRSQQSSNCVKFIFRAS